MSFILALLACSTAEEKMIFPTTLLSEKERYEISYVSDPSPLPLNEDFTVTMTINRINEEASATDSIVADINAEMPDHGHGMPQSPDVSPLGDGQFIAEGMFFQMPGYWHITTWITEEDGAVDKVIFEVDCCL